MNKNFANGRSGLSGFGWRQGEVADQPHVQIPEGTYEEEYARRGFFGRTSHLYHRHPPTGWLSIEGNLKPRAYGVTKLEGGPTQGESEVFLHNNDVSIGIAKLSKPMDFWVRNADADEVRFIHEGSGQLETDFGVLNYRAGHYVVIPRGTTHRWVSKDANVHLVIESIGEIELPDRGLLGRHAQFDPMIMGIPELPETEPSSVANQKFEVRIKRQKQWTKVLYPFHPLNCSGWKGDLTVWSIHVDDIRPIVSPRYHLPPPVHTTFVAQNFVICSFLPRPLESEDGAMKVPFYHRNIDFDEVLFYHAGNFFSREGIGAGSVTWHPFGIHHGPHPNAAKNAASLKETGEIAVMIDTRNPLEATRSAEKVEFEKYHMSWSADQKR